jgi:hypothetical protein
MKDSPIEQCFLGNEGVTAITLLIQVKTPVILQELNASEQHLYSKTYHRGPLLGAQDASTRSANESATCEGPETSQLGV